jgi:hypothetical protein
MDFPSKVDGWFLALFWGMALVMALGAPAIWAKRSKGAGALLGALALLFVAIGFSARALTYRVAPDGLVSVHGGLLPGGPLFRVDEVISIVPSHNARSAPASSLDRLMVTHSRGVVLISPEDKAGFLDTIAAQRPTLVRSELSLHAR